MNLSIPIIHKKSELAQYAARLNISSWQWQCVYRPLTYAWLGWLPDTGLLVRFQCYENGPKREVHTPLTHVHFDSAVEVFLSAIHENGPSIDIPYVNFEVNANGALYACTGVGRKGRELISDAEYRLAGIETEIKADSWQTELVVPLAVLRRIFCIENLVSGDALWLNLHKISESAEIEHYASLSPISSLFPNFHRPDCFIRAVITENAEGNFDNI